MILFAAVSFLMHPIRFTRDVRDSRRRQRESAEEVAILLLAHGLAGDKVAESVRCMYPYEAKEFRKYVAFALRSEYESQWAN